MKRRGSNHSGVRARPGPISESFGIPVPYNGQVTVTEGVPVAAVSGRFPGREAGATELDVVLKKTKPRQPSSPSARWAENAQLPARCSFTFLHVVDVRP